MHLPCAKIARCTIEMKNEKGFPVKKYRALGKPYEMFVSEKVTAFT